MRLALTEVEAGHRVGDEPRIARVWKLFLLLPRILFHRPPEEARSHGSPISPRGQWIQMLITSLDFGDQAMSGAAGRQSSKPWKELPVPPGNDRTLR